MNNLIYYGFYVGFILAVILNAAIYFYIIRNKYQKNQENLIKKTIELLGKLDSIENKLRGKNKMNDDIKKLAKYIDTKLKEQTEEITDRIDELEETFLGDGQEEEQSEEEPSPFEDMEDEETEEEPKEEVELEEEEQKDKKIKKLRQQQKTNLDELEDYGGERTKKIDKEEVNALAKKKKKFWSK